MSVRDRPAPIGGGSLTGKTTTDLKGSFGLRKWIEVSNSVAVLPGFIYGRVEKWLSHLAHNQKSDGSTPSPASINRYNLLATSSA